MFAVGIISSLVMRLTGVTNTENQEALNEMCKSLPVIVYFIATTGAGFFEEMLFRVGLFELLFNKWPKIAAIMSCLLFTLAHVPTNFASFVAYGSMSLVLTGLYYKYRNFYLNSSVHFLWNSLAVIVFLMSSK
ncbi:hypothetical protein Hs30E_00230 [Lactococcus hodotermopsidis]|uniref:CAAX prenyl protease 2/Lysostaphin resistance protein A-like domain-containing protein n=2 Tax=Pseudolactococcus hodotermopsidis TaxID=2709157 RepID=A0A6A0B848_9LACT|nr:hypothetical protein Hs30E_00230 [Lactococcus hodotermopsidis]